MSIIWSTEQPIEYVIVGVDPGKMTGLFTAVKASDTLVIERLQLKAGEVFNHVNCFLRDCDMKGLAPEDIHFSVEKFFITQRTVRLSRQYDAIEVTGVVRALAASYDASGACVHVTSKSSVSKLAGNETLSKIGWLSKAHRHANDAARQAFATLLQVDYPTWDKLYRGELESTIYETKG